MGIPEGYELLAGHSRENARKALALAQERGFPVETVLSVKDGYHVPLEDSTPPVIGGYLEPATGESTEDEGGESLSDLTVPELKDLAHERGVDLGGATRKDDIIAAIEQASGNTDADENEGE